MTENIKGIKTTINFRGDLKVESYWKQWDADDIFTCVKYTKAGLVLLIDPNGEEISVAKRQVNALI